MLKTVHYFIISYTNVNKFYVICSFCASSQGSVKPAQALLHFSRKEVQWKQDLSYWLAPSFPHSSSQGMWANLEIQWKTSKREANKMLPLADYDCACHGSDVGNRQ